MNTMNILFAAILASSITISLYMGAGLSIHLPEWDRRLDRKPFNCRPCLTFHILVIISFFNSLFTHSVWLFAVSLIAAFIVFAIVRFIDNKKIIK